MKKPFYLLDLNCNGVSYNLSTQDLTVPTSRNTEIFYKQGVRDFSINLVLGPDSKKDVSISLYPGVIDVAKLVSQGYNPLLFTAFVYRIFDGESKNQSILVASGNISNPVFETKYDEFSFSISSNRDDISVISATAKVTNKTFPIDSNFLIPPDNAVYPLVFGAPGEISPPLSGQLHYRTGSPVIVGDYLISDANLANEIDELTRFADAQQVELDRAHDDYDDYAKRLENFHKYRVLVFKEILSFNQWLLENAGDYSFDVAQTPTQTAINWEQQIMVVAGHKVAANAITIYDKTNHTFVTRDLVGIKDNLGRDITICYNDGYVDDPGHFDFSNDHYAIWSFGAGLINNNKIVLTIGDLIEFLQSLNSNLFDSRSQKNELAKLNLFNVSGYLDNDSIKVMDFIDELIKYFPIQKIDGINGVYYKFIDYKNNKSEYAAYLTNQKRVSQLSFSSLDNVYNNILIKYKITDENDIEQVVIGSGDTYGLPQDLVDVHIRDSHKRQDPVSLAQSPTQNLLNAINGESVITYPALYTPTSAQDYSFEYLNTENYLSHICKLSRDAYGRKDLRIDMKYVWDENTAALIGEHLVYKHALPKLCISYSVDFKYSQLTVGDKICLSDDEIYISNRTALIEQIETTNDEIILSLILLDEI